VTEWVAVFQADPVLVGDEARQFAVNGQAAILGVLQ
jgi:hypothetical protein